MIGRKLHHKGSRISRKHLCFFQNDAGTDNRRNSHKVSAGSNPPGAAKEGACNQRNNRELGAAGHKGCGHNRHLPVTVIFNGSGCHNAGYAAAASNQHRYKGFSGKTELSENPVHDKGNSCHISAGLQKGQEDEKHQHLRHKSKHSAHAGHNTVQYKALKPVCTANCIKYAFH